MTMEKTYHSHDGLFDCFDIILKKRFISRHQGTIFNDGLADDQSVKWISVNKRQFF